MGLSKRVTRVGRMSEAELVDHYARCRAVCFTPIGEDYGFVAVEAFSARKAVLTCADSGGPTDLVRDGITGLVSDPAAEALAISVARVMDDVKFAEQLGSAAAAEVESLTWRSAVQRLVIVSAPDPVAGPDRITGWDIVRSEPPNRGSRRKPPRRLSTITCWRMATASWSACRAAKTAGRAALLDVLRQRAPTDSRSSP